MSAEKRRDAIRRILIIAFSSTTVAGTGILALWKGIGQGFSVLIGYVILLASSALISAFMSGSGENARRTAALIFTVGILVVTLGFIGHYLFYGSSGGEGSHDGLTWRPPGPPGDESTAADKEKESDSSSVTLYAVDSDSQPEPRAAVPPDSIEIQPDRPEHQGQIGSDIPVFVPSVPLFIEPTAICDDRVGISSVPVFAEPDAAVSAASSEDAVSASSPVAAADIPSVPVFIEPSAVVSVSSDVPGEPSFIEATIDNLIVSAPVSADLDDECGSDIAITGSLDADTAVSGSGFDAVSETVTADESGFFAGMTPEEEAFWASFYIEGENSLTFEDGTYYMALYVNGTDVGDVTVEMISDEANLVADELRSIIGETVTKSAYDRIFAENTSLISLPYLESCGVRTELDSASYAISLTFDPEDMPVRILSISGRSLVRRSARPIADGLNLQPAVFTLASDYSLTARVGNFRGKPWHDTLSFTFSSSNSARLWDLYLDFNYSMDFSYDYFSFRFGSYRFYYDFPDAAIRLSFGNVSSRLFSPSGTTVGIQFEKSYSYARPGYTRPSQFEQVLVIEKTSEVTVYNEGREIYRSTLDIGTYSLRDFVLYTGANKILVRVEPLDGSEPTEIEFDILYSSSLLAPGEVLYGGSFVTGRRIVSNSQSKLDGAFRIPMGRGTSLEYDPRNLVLSGYIRAGLTESLTLDTTAAVQNQPTEVSGLRINAKTAFELTHANVLGTTRYNLNITERAAENGSWGMPGFYAGIGHQVSTGWSPLSSFSIGANWSSPEETGVDKRHRIALNGSVSGRIGIMSWSLSGTGTILTDDITRSSWNTSLSTSFTLSSSIWLTASMSVGGRVDAAPSISGRIGATLRFGNTGVNASAGLSDAYVTARYSEGRHSASVTGRTYSYTDWNRASLDASYSYAGNYVDVSAGVNASHSFNTIGADLTLSTSTLFADGLLAFAANKPSNYILMSQSGALKGNKISIGSPGSSAMEDVRSTFGVSLYDRLPSSEASDSFIVYSQGDSSFSSFSSFGVNIPASRRKGYVLRLSAEERYAVSGEVFLPDGTPYLNGASPMYEVDIVDGVAEFASTESYVFTDTDGRFTTDSLLPGLYGFDIMYDGGWILALFEVTDRPDDLDRIQCVVQGDLMDDVVIPDIYSGYVMFTLDSLMTSDEFFSMIFGGEAV